MNVIPAEEFGRTYNRPVKPPHLTHNQGKRHNHILFLCPLSLVSFISCSSVDLERDPTLTEDRLVRLVGKKMDAKWEVFATHLRVERNVREGIHSECLGNVTRCFSEVTDRWLSGEEGTGDLPRTWDTVFNVLKVTGYPLLVQDIKNTLTENQVCVLVVRTHAPMHARTQVRTHTHSCSTYNPHLSGYM